MNLRFELAKAEEEGLIRDLLKEASLPYEDIHPHISSFIVAKDSGDLVGCVGLEISGDIGLLRSLAVSSSFRGQGIGNSLCQKIIGYGRERGVKVLYLLTTDQAEFFKKRGFQIQTRESAPEQIQVTTQFKALCPSSAILMSRSLTS